ncbi:MAG: DUF3137 domain-containing protein [Lewinella sp.]|nr:DUF3137 domain-containing protein [Lewinella sp.]
MEIPRLAAFRKFYISTIYPELLRNERLRKRMLYGVYGSLLFIVAICTLAFIFKFGFLVLLLAVPFLFYLVSIYRRFDDFRSAFKSSVISLIMEFLNQAPNFLALTFDHLGTVAQDRFTRSGLFGGRELTYRGEDYIKGIVGEMPFELSEIYVQDISQASNRLKLVFGGIFIHAVFNENNEGGHLAAWPKALSRHTATSIRDFIIHNGKDADIELKVPAFADYFLTLAKPGTTVHKLLTEPMQKALIRFVETTGRVLYFSILNQDLFVAIAYERDLLEPYFFRSNLSFELVCEFYTDLILILNTIQDFDQTR